MSDERAAAIESFIVTEITGGIADGALPHDEDLLAADLIDSLGITELVGFLEARFGIRVEDEDLTPDNFRSVEVISAFVSRKGG
jgi:acyl carrier protein